MPRKLPNLKIKVNTLPVAESQYISRLPFILAAIGSTASGKSYLAISLLKLLRKERNATNLFIICPTLKSNVLYTSVIDPEKDFTYDGLDNVYEDLLEIERKVSALAEIYRKDLEYSIAYRLFVDGHSINTFQENLLEERGWKFVQPIRPQCVLVLDDLSHSKIFSTSRKNPFTNLVLRSRHVGSGIGLSILMICQSYTSGIPRALRQNLTHLALFNTQSEKEIKAFYEEICGQVSYSEFVAKFKEYTKDKHSYMWCDMIKKTLDDSF